MASKAEQGVLYACVAVGKAILVSCSVRDGNFVQYAKLIIASGVEEDGDHSRTYHDKSGKCAGLLFSFCAYRLVYMRGMGVGCGWRVLEICVRVALRMRLPW